jgi:hypothetical protein
MRHSGGGSIRNIDVEERLSEQDGFWQSPGTNQAPGKKMGMLWVTRTVTHAVVVLSVVGQAAPVQATSIPSLNGALAGNGVVDAMKFPDGSGCHMPLE